LARSWTTFSILVSGIPEDIVDPGSRRRVRQYPSVKR
jgi:hypothetical protein